LSFSVRAQVSTSSPYSRYAVGDLQLGGFSKNLGMGGLSLGLMQPFNLNHSNPASYSSLLLTTFEAGGSASMYEAYTSTSFHSYQYNADFAYLAMGFPLIPKKWGMSFGLVPYSAVGYSMSEQKYNELGDAEQHIYEGSGGLNQFYVGTGFGLGRNFYFGVNASFLFGTIDQLRKVEYADNSFYNAKVTDETYISDFYFNAGLIKSFDSLSIAKSDSIKMFDNRIESYEDSISKLQKLLKSTEKVSKNDSILLSSEREKISGLIEEMKRMEIEADSAREKVKVRRQKSDWSLSIGLTGAPPISLKATHSQIAESYYFFNGIEAVRDTIYKLDDKRGEVVLPFNVGLGFTFREGTRLITGLDFSLQNWQEYSIFGEQDSLANSWRVNGGLQWTPNDRSIKSYFKLVQYRIGGHYEQTYLQLKNTQLTDYGVSLGFGFPMKRVATVVQMAFELGRRGTTVKNLVEMNYVKFTLGFTLNDRWFIPDKFD